MREEDEGERLLLLGLAVYWNSDALERTSLNGIEKKSFVNVAKMTSLR